MNDKINKRNIVYVQLDPEADRDIIEALPSYGKGPWIREQLRNHIRNKPPIGSDDHIKEVVDQYLREKFPQLPPASDTTEESKPNTQMNNTSTSWSVG